MSPADFKNKKLNNEKISMITCYDYTSAQILNTTAVDCLLVGDSVAMTVHGYNSTVQATTEMMALHTSAVSRGAPDKFIVADLPFMSYRKSLAHSLDAAEQLMRAGANAVKLEGADGNLEVIERLVESGIPVMGHLGLTPQFVNQFGGFKVQGRTDEAQQKIFNEAVALERAGCFSVVLECVPHILATKTSKNLKIPTIGIGAGVDTDGQVLVMQDLLGLSQGFKPKFLRQFADGTDVFKSAFENFHKSVVDKSFPNASESYE